MFSSASQDSLTAGETSQEWQPTPQVQMKLHSVSNFLRIADRRVGPVRSQLSTVVESISSPTLLSRLITLYKEATSWHTRRQILSVFVNDYSKTELLRLIPGLTKWKIDEARKPAFVACPGQVIEPPVLQRCRLDPVKVDHFLDFISARLSFRM